MKENLQILVHRIDYFKKNLYDENESSLFLMEQNNFELFGESGSVYNLRDINDDRKGLISHNDLNRSGGGINMG